MLVFSRYNQADFDPSFWRVKDIEKEDEGTIPTSSLFHFVTGSNVNLMTLIGYGGGFYDRFLEKHPDSFSIGLGYSFQIVDEIPKDAWDIAVEHIITD